MIEHIPITLVVVRSNAKVETTTYSGYLAQSSSDRDFNEIVKNQREGREVEYAATIFSDGGVRLRYARPQENKTNS